ncbi:hypothetical protein H0H92_013272 [Tricholoma furcatifolium]|nr:hypothetical protein H0H92_013272 [Tricholoma furcatifolium]
MYPSQPTFETHEAENRSLSIGSIPSLPIIVTASVVFLAVDATIHLLRRRIYEPRAIDVSSETQTSQLATQPHQSLTRFVDKSRSILSDVQALERQLNIAKSCRPSRTSIKRKRCHDVSRAPKTQPSCEFSAFCERLLLTNKIWKQEKELKDLRAASAKKSRAQCDAALNGFCDQLLLWNRIWKLEREAAELVKEKDRIQRERVSAVTRAAKRMVQDVQKERMVEELVKDLVKEMGATNAELESLRKQHEMEVDEINGDWLKDYRRVTQELEQLRLAQTARLVEQEVSNSMEEALFESLREGKERIERLEENLRVVGYASSDESTLNGASDVDTELSTSSTCVSSKSPLRRSSSTIFERTIERKRHLSQGPRASTAYRKLQHSRSFSMSTSSGVDNVVNHTNSVSAIGRNTRTANLSGKPLAVRNRTTSVTIAPRTPTSPSSASSISRNGLLANRPPWRL